MRAKRMATAVLASSLLAVGGAFALPYTNNLIAHFDGTQMQLDENGKVSKWLNQALPGKDAWTVSTDEAARPTPLQLRNESGETYTVLDFDGIHNHLTMTGDTNNYDGNTFTWIIAYKSGDTNQNGKALFGTAYDHIDGGDTAANTGTWQTFVNSGNHLYVAGRSASGGFKSVSTYPPDNGWHVISGKWDGNDRLYAWLDKNYLGKSSGVDAHPTGHHRSRIGSGAGATASGFFKGMIAEIIIFKENVADADRLAIEDELLAKYGTLSDLAPYDYWAQTYDLSGADADMGGNPDGDLANNLAEYALGGDPTDPSDMGHLPHGEVVRDGAGSWFQFVYYMRNDAAGRGLVYEPQACTDLIIGDWGTNGISVVGSGIFDSEFDSVTTRVSTAAEEGQFMDLNIQYLDAPE